MIAVKRKILESEIKNYPSNLESDSVETIEIREAQITRINGEIKSVDFKKERFARLRKSLRKRSVSIL